MSKSGPVAGKQYNAYCNVCGENKPATSYKASTCLDCLGAGLKYCPRCGQIKHVEDFSKSKANKDGYKSLCRSCHSRTSWESTKKTCKEDAEYNELRKQRNREYCSNRYHTDEEWRQTRGEQSNELSKLWRINKLENMTPDEHTIYNQQKAAYSRNFYAENEDRREYIIAKNHERRANYKGAFTYEEWQECLQAYDYKCAYCGEKHNLTRDHIVAVSEGGYNYAFNLVPACAHCNGSKGAKDVVEWYSAQPFYDEDKLRNIHKRYRLKQEELLRQEG